MLKRLEIAGFKSFAKKTVLDYSSSVTAIVGPNGSGKSNIAEGFRFALGEQSMKSMRGKRSEDLIWAGSHATPRSNRAAVAVVFDNRPRNGNARMFPKLEYDEVTIERAVFRSGESEYLVNGSKVRLRDVQELLASANVGDTGHHIISQGEADRILRASPEERRSMLEDALGLKAFEFKKQEAERKLEKTGENMNQVEALRRELLPHLKFLSKQVERLERAETLKGELAATAREYFPIEELYVKSEKEASRAREKESRERLQGAVAELKAFDDRASGGGEGGKYAQAVRDAEHEVEQAMSKLSEISREIGKTEGALAEAKRRSEHVAREPYVKVPREDFALLRSEVEKQAGISDDAELGALRAALRALHTAVTAFFERFAIGKDDAYLAEEEQSVMRLEGERDKLAKEEGKRKEAADRAREALMKARERSLEFTETRAEEQHRILAVAETKAKEEAALAREEEHRRSLGLLEDELSRDRAEILAIAGSAAFSYEPLSALPREDRHAQEERKKHMERLKIRVEEAGGSGEDVRGQYKEAEDREAFLSRELEDLKRSADSLRTLIEDLNEELGKTFGEGLAKVNDSFGEFFALMFGGGGARLVLEDLSSTDDEDAEEEAGEDAPPQKARKPGIEISVHLPKKRVQSLMQLSGGERALTSIALIFAMSQVNPPPFLILDETDAALDEANSRRYGDMIENLAKKSQLVVVTHNRETMSRAGILYGVTMGNDGVSKLLSVKFDEAVAVAK